MDIDQINIIQLSNSLRICETDIIEGRNKLSLTASLLQKINYTLQEREYDHVSLCTPTSEPEEPIKFLQELIHKTPKLTVTQRVKRETWRVDISRFTSLKYLELNKIPMHLVEGMQSLRPQLQVLVCERCTDCLEEILGSSNHVWEELQTAKLCYNDFVFLCPFTNTPWLQYLDLSYNKIEDKLSLQTLKNLTYLNLSFNFLTSVPMLSEEVCHKLKVLLINNNYVQDLSAISVFDNLEVLDVSNNLLADHSAISPILFLPYLRSINLSSNPISYHPHHRFHTCSYLNKGVIADEFLLDSQPLNQLEQKEIGRRGETYRHLGISLPRDFTCLPSGSLNQSMVRSLSKKKVRDVVIEEGTSSQQPKIAVKPPETNQEHLETKKQVEELRERFGGDHWLHSHAGSFVQDLMGLQRATGNGLLSSTPLERELFAPSPKFVTALDKMDPGTFDTSSRFDSSASEEYVTAITTQVIIEKIPNHVEVTTSEISDQELKEHLLVETESETKSTEPVETQERQELSGQESEGTKSSEDSTAEKKKEKVDEAEDESDDGQLWLVQIKKQDGSLAEIFLTLTEKSARVHVGCVATAIVRHISQGLKLNVEIREKSVITGRTTTKWSLESVESCEKVNNEPPTIHITFNTIRKACRQRTYIMEFSDAQELLKRVRSFLEARSLSAMNQVAYRCMKCSSMFSMELQPTKMLALSGLENGSNDAMPVTKCPACGSTLVVEMEEAPLPSAKRETEPSTEPSAESYPLPLTSSPSDCSIGSAASLDQNTDVETVGGGTKEGTPTPRRYDSDIEVISNPSQSSIEVLEVQARLQGVTNGPIRKRSNEERSTFVKPQLNTVPEVQPNQAGLTESSSSGSLTDSVCTTYENNPVALRRKGMSDVPEESTPTPSSTYTSLLEGLIQSVTSKLSPKNSPAVGSPLDETMQYSFTDFTKVDHRLKLYLYQNVLKHDNEEILFLLRGHVFKGYWGNIAKPTPGILLGTTHFLHALHIIGPEIGDISDWIDETQNISGEIAGIFAFPWGLGIGFNFTDHHAHMILCNDPSQTKSFFNFLKNIMTDDVNLFQNITVEEEASPRPEGLLEQLVTRTVKTTSGPVDPSVIHVSLCTPITTTKNEEEVITQPLGLLLITTTDILLIQEDFSWLIPAKSQKEHQPQSAAEQKMANIVDVSLTDFTLKLHFLNEEENQEEVWSVGLPSLEAVDLIVESIRGPWEQLFSVPLQLTRH